MLKMVIPTLLGVEGFVKDELIYRHFANVKVRDGYVFFEGDEAEMARANLICRTGERVEIVMAEFTAHSFEDLYQGTRTVSWADFIGSKDAFPVSKASTRNSDLHSVPDIQSVVKKAIVDSMHDVYGRSEFEESASIHSIRVRILNNEVMLTLDTSGESLYKRGYRKNAGDAPIRETLAASMCEIARVHSDSFVCDPMCGSGTLVIEAALRAKNIAPGLYRRFQAERWSDANRKLFAAAREQAKTEIKKDVAFRGLAMDIDPAMVKMAEENAENAKISRYITFKEQDVRAFKPDFVNFEKNKRGIVLCNPPYGERLLDTKEAEKLYKTLGVVFAPEDGYSYTVISPDEDFETHFGRKANVRRKLYNGMLKCQVYTYLNK